MVTAYETLLISVHPQYADLILSGVKTVELRRTRPRITAGGQVLVYASAPRMALVGGFEVDGLIEASPAMLWKQVKTTAGVTKAVFDNYFAGADHAYGILVKRVWSIWPSVPLARLRRSMPGFHPPQSYRYIGPAEVRSLA